MSVFAPVSDHGVVRKLKVVQCMKFALKLKAATLAAHGIFDIIRGATWLLRIDGRDHVHIGIGLHHLWEKAWEQTVQ
jgi:hypothetical protein